MSSNTFLRFLLTPKNGVRKASTPTAISACSMPTFSAKNPIGIRLKDARLHEKPPIVPDITALCSGTSFCAAHIVTETESMAKKPVAKNTKRANKGKGFIKYRAHKVRGKIVKKEILTTFKAPMCFSILELKTVAKPAKVKKQVIISPVSKSVQPCAFSKNGV
ncbi:hypothetical protein tpqmel_0642 [Candidatus Gastranaerophilus sp. (ex Termes propinquus)]|nr:hypothetical protein tpqmel_0642 [Candidatus Gastranaerophilus sp. (ex Termes propinquus)]